MDDSFEEHYSVTIKRDRETENVLAVFWRRADGKLENSMGPAVTRFAPETGKVTEERWMRANNTSRLEEDGPAVIFYDGNTGNPVREMYFADGELHRLRGAADIERCPDTGRITLQRYYRHDKPFRPKKIEPTGP